MAPPKGDKARKRKRKARTEVSSPSDSSSESEKSSPAPQGRQNAAISNDEEDSPDNDSHEVAAQAQKPEPKDPEQAFEELYLKQATKEFANDIDKLRSAPDFNEKNVPVLIKALKQGTACFGEGERRKIGSATK